MFKYAFSSLLKREALQIWPLAKALKTSSIACRNSLACLRAVCKKSGRIELVHFALFQCTKLLTKTKITRPALLLGGILTALDVDKVEEPDLFSFEVIKNAFLVLFGYRKPEEGEEKLILTIKKGILLIKKQKFVEAEEMLHSALMLAQELKDEDGITYVCDIMANLAFEVNQYEKAEKLFVSVLQRLLAKGEEQDSNKVVDISLKLAKIYESKRDFWKAEQGYKFCKETLDKKLETNDEDTLALWGMTMDWYARFLLVANRKPEALVALKKAHEMCIKINGGEHEQTVILLNDLGTVSSLTGDYDSAMEYLKKAKDISDKLPEMRDRASVYINLGQLYLFKEMWDEAKKSCQEGFRIAKDDEDTMGLSEAKICLDKINDILKGGQTNNKSK